MLDVDATVSALTEAPGESALLTDFDGTMSAIVEHPADAVPLPGVIDLLGALVPAFGRIAVVSGRPIAFLQHHLPVPGLEYAGSYGLERMGRDGVRRIDPRVEPFLANVAAAGDEFDARLPGVVVERKVGLAVTVHWRMCPEREAEIRAAADEVAREMRLEQLAGRHAIELRPPVPVDKGTAVAELVTGFAAAAFAGDDRGDLVAFGAIDAAVRTGSLQRGVRIGVRSPEMPDEMPAHSDVIVEGPVGMVELLRALAARVSDQVT